MIPALGGYNLKEDIMSRNNRRERQDSDVVVEETVEETVEEVMIEEVAEVVEETVEEAVTDLEPLNSGYGVVSKCDRLNVREKPDFNAPVIAIINTGDEVLINHSSSTEHFYNVKVNNIVGYCHHDFITCK